MQCILGMAGYPALVPSTLMKYEVTELVRTAVPRWGLSPRWILFAMAAGCSRFCLVAVWEVGREGELTGKKTTQQEKIRGRNNSNMVRLCAGFSHHQICGSEGQHGSDASTSKHPENPLLSNIGCDLGSRMCASVCVDLFLTTFRGTHTRLKT